MAQNPGDGATPMPGINAELLVSMMDCVDTSLFSPQQLANWEHMKAKVKTAAATNAPLTMTGSDLHMVKTELAKTNLDGAEARLTPGSAGMEQSVDFRSPLHREASIQDVLATLLDQQPPSSRIMNSSGGSFLLSSEVKNRAQGAASSGADEAARPTLKSLLSSNDFTMTEKKESLRHLLSFIDSSFASSTPEPLTQVYKDAENGNLQRLSSLQLMRSFMTNPGATAGASNAGGSGPQSNMGMRTTSFEIIQAMLNATSNQAIQKPMTSQDSFRFQHLAKTLESIETDVAYDNEDYGGDDVVQVDNLDNLLDYHGGASSTASATTSQSQQTASSVPPPPPPPANASNAMAAGFVDTQTLLNPSRSIYSELNNGNGSYANSYGQVMDQGTMHGMYPSVIGGSSALPSVDMMGQGMTFQGMDQSKLDPMQAQQQLLQQQLIRQEQQQKQQQQQQQQQYNQLYQSALLQQNMMINPTGYGLNGGHNQFSSMMMQPTMLPQKQQAQQALRINNQAKQQQQLKADGSVQICSALGCNHPARVKGMCKLHGGGRRCKVEGCMKSAQTGHLCIAHGGGKPCNVEGCPKTAQSRGLCKQHGGGVRCKFEGCTKSCQSGGFCRGHGGGKRCEYPNCTKWAQKNGHCAKHAQEIAQRMQQQQQLVHP